MSAEAVLARRYRRLMVAYPAGYRAARGEEILATYLEASAASGRTTPSRDDVFDLLRGGLRQRLRASGALGLVEALPLAAIVAMTVGTVLATIWLLRVDLVAGESRQVAAEGGATFGLFYTKAALVWLGWLAAAVALPLLPRRYVRVTLGLATVVAVVIGVVWFGLRDGYGGTLLQVLLAQCVLALLAFAVPDRAPTAQRVAPLAAGLVTAALAGATGTIGNGGGRELQWDIEDCAMLEQVAGIAAALLTAVGLAIAMIGMRRHDRRGGWVALVLLCPASLLAVPVLHSMSPAEAIWMRAAFDSRATEFVVLDLVAVLLTAVLFPAVAMAFDAGGHRDLVAPRPGSPAAAGRGRVRRRSGWLALASAGGVVAATFGGLVAWASTPVPAHGPVVAVAVPVDPGTAATVLERARAVAASQPSAQPDLAGRFVYVKSQYRGQRFLPARCSELGPTTAREAWSPVTTGSGDGVFIENGQRTILVNGGREGMYRNLPTDPEALLRQVYAETAGRGRTVDGEAFDAIREAIGTMVPAQVNAALLVAAARIPGAKVIGDAVDAADRHGMSIAYDELGERTEIIFDPQTLVHLGTRRYLVSANAEGPVGKVVSVDAILVQKLVDRSEAVDKLEAVDR